MYFMVNNVANYLVEGLRQSAQGEGIGNMTSPSRSLVSTLEVCTVPSDR